MASACGSTASKAAPPTTHASNTTAAAPATGDPILVGEINSVASTINSNPDQLAILNAAIDGINNRGGINGRPLKLDFCDGQSDPNLELACARKLISDDVVATVRDLTVFSGAQSDAVLSDAKVPRLWMFANAAQDFSCSMCFPLDGGTALQTVALLSYAKDKLHVKSVYLALPASTGAVISEALHSAITKMGLQLVGSTAVPTTVADPSPIAQKIVEAKPDLLVMPVTRNLMLQIVPSLSLAGFTSPIATGAGSLNPGDFSKLGSAASQILIDGPVPPVTAASQFRELQQLKNDLAAESRRGTANVPGGDIKGSTLQVYFSVEALASLLKSIKGPISRQSLVSLLQTPGTTVDLGFLTWESPTGTAPVAQMPQVRLLKEYIFKIENNVQVLAQSAPVDISSLVQ